MVECQLARRAARLRLLHDGTPERPILVSNARCLTEGVDVPTLDGVVFADPKRSKTDIVQAVGRAIRRSAEKKIGTIVLLWSYLIRRLLRPLWSRLTSGTSGTCWER